MNSAANNLTQAMTDGRVLFSEDDLADRFSTEHANLIRCRLGQMAAMDRRKMGDRFDGACV